MGLVVWLQVEVALASVRMQRVSDWRPPRVTDGEEARNALTKHTVAPNGGLGRRTPEPGAMERERAGKSLKV